MKNLILIILIILFSSTTYSNVYLNYNEAGNVVSLSSNKMLQQDPATLKDKYLFVHKDPEMHFASYTFSKENVLKVGNSYIFNENSMKDFGITNEEVRFERIITVDEQIKNFQPITKSVLTNNFTNEIKLSNVDETKPKLIYKPYAIIFRYSLFNKKNQKTDEWTEESSMKFLTLKECNTEITKFKKIEQKKVDDFLKKNKLLLTNKIEARCMKIYITN